MGGPGQFIFRMAKPVKYLSVTVPKYTVDDGGNLFRFKDGYSSMRYIIIAAKLLLDFHSRGYKVIVADCQKDGGGADFLKVFWLQGAAAGRAGESAGECTPSPVGARESHLFFLSGI